MDQAHDAKRSPDAALPLTWPIVVQCALAILTMASLFFFLGRWSAAQPNDAPAAYAAEPTAKTGLDLNLATKAELRLIPGIGDALAQRIIDHRERIGRFRSIDELRKVFGIGPKTLERIRHQVFVAPTESFVSTTSDDETDEMATPRFSPRPPGEGSGVRVVSKKASELTDPINVNRANQAELQKLPGIGPKLSQRILDERAKTQFKTVDDLRRVPGIGPKTLEKLRPHVTVS